MNEGMATGSKVTAMRGLNHPFSRLFSFDFPWIVMAFNLWVCRTQALARALLYYMRQLVRQQLFPRRHTRSVLPRPKDNVVPHRIGQCVDRLRRFSRLRIRVHPYLTEVITET